MTSIYKSISIDYIGSTDHKAIYLQPSIILHNLHEDINKDLALAWLKSRYTIFTESVTKEVSVGLGVRKSP